MRDVVRSKKEGGAEAEILQCGRCYGMRRVRWTNIPK